MKKQICLLLILVLLAAGAGVPQARADMTDFTEGYVQVASGTQAYSEPSASASVAGVFQKKCTVYASAAGDGWLEVAFYAGQKTWVLYVPESAAQQVSGAAELKAALIRLKAPRYNGWPLPTVSFKTGEAATKTRTPEPTAAATPEPTAAATPEPTVAATPEPTATPAAAGQTATQTPAAATSAPAVDTFEGFEKGYIQVPKGTAAYTAPSSGVTAGYFTKAASVYAVPAGNGWLEAAFLQYGTKKTMTVYLPAGAVTLLSEKDTLLLKVALAKAGAPKYGDGYLNTVRFTEGSATAAPAASATPTPDAGTAEEEETAEATPVPTATPVQRGVTVTASAEEAKAGETVTLTAAVSGVRGTLNYQWQHSQDGETWKASTLSGAKTRTLSFTATEELLSESYRCLVVINATEALISDAVSIAFDDGTRPKYRALLIGQSNYAAPLAALPGCQNDVSAMRGMLTGLTNGFTVSTAANLTGDQIRSAVRSAFSGAKEQDVSLFYYSGHGSAESGTGRGALMGLDNDMVTMAELASILSGVNGRVIVILDSCYSGAAVTSKGETLLKSKSASDPLDTFLQDVISSFSGIGRSYGFTAKSGELAVSKFVVLAAARYAEISGEGTIDGYRCGVFTYSLLKGMGCTYPVGAYKGSMPADNGDQEVTLMEIYSYAYREANSIYSPQHVVYYGPDEEVLFRRN